jgi:hypothetical protein
MHHMTIVHCKGASHIATVTAVVVHGALLLLLVCCFVQRSLSLLFDMCFLICSKQSTRKLLAHSIESRNDPHQLRAQPAQLTTRFAAPRTRKRVRPPQKGQICFHHKLVASAPTMALIKCVISICALPLSFFFFGIS